MSARTEVRVHQPPASLVAAATISGMAAYQALVDEANADFEGYWGRLAREFVSWKTPFTKVLDSSNAPVRQWVLSLPIPLRLLLAAQPVLVTPVLQVVHRVITRHLLDQTGLKAFEADSGAVTLIQRFGSAANLNIHLHCLVLDGVYRRTDGEPAFVQADSPADEELQALLQRIITRLMKLLTRRGVLVEEEEEGGSSYLADAEADANSDEARALRPLQAAACTYRIAFGPRAGQKVFTVQGVMPRDAVRDQELCADHQGFSLHAAVRCDADQRQRLEQLCRYITRPALANERVQINSAGMVVLKLKTAWRDGTTHIVMSPLHFLQRLAALAFLNDCFLPFPAVQIIVVARAPIDRPFCPRPHRTEHGANPNLRCGPVPSQFRQAVAHPV